MFRLLVLLNNRTPLILFELLRASHKIYLATIKLLAVGKSTLHKLEAAFLVDLERHRHHTLVQLLLVSRSAKTTSLPIFHHHNRILSRSSIFTGCRQSELWTHYLMLG